MARSLLYLLNVSNPDQFAADSGWLFADILAPALLAQGAEMSIASPVPLSDARIRFLKAPTPATKYRARFGGDVELFADLLRQARPSVVIANQVESAPSIRAAMLEAKIDAAIAGYCHYLPFHLDSAGRLCLDASLNDAGLGRAALMQFLTGLTACDRILVHSRIAERWLLTCADLFGVDLGDRVRIVPPPCDPRLVRDVGDITPPGGDLPARVIYNHRLYEHYGTGRFLALASQLVSPAIEIMVMDMFGAARAKRRPLDSSPDRYRKILAEMPGVHVVSDGGVRDRYRALLASAHLGLAPFRPGCTWSMSLIDCHAMGLPVVAPRMGWLADAVDPALGFDEPAEAVKIAERLLSDPAAWLRASQTAQRGVRALAPSIVAARYLAAIS